MRDVRGMGRPCSWCSSRLKHTHAHLHARQRGHRGHRHKAGNGRRAHDARTQRTQVGLVNLLWRHYSWPAMAEARKVLGGAGPAIAAVPASILWAGISLVDLFRDVATKRTHPAKLLPRVGFYGFTATGQVRVQCGRSRVLVQAVACALREGGGVKSCCCLAPALAASLLGRGLSALPSHTMRTL